LEFSGPLVITMHLNQNVYWQNIAPVSGRQFVANDVVFYYDRIYGLGMGYTKPISTTTNTMIQALVSVVAVDKYTVNFTFQGVSQETIAETMFGPMGVPRRRRKSLRLTLVPVIQSSRTGTMKSAPDRLY